MENYYLKEIIVMVKEMEKEKNINPQSTLNL